jgi:hypothetical protein
MIISIKKFVGKQSDSLKSYFRNRKYNKLSKLGLNPFIHISADGSKYSLNQVRKLLISNQFIVPNVSGFYHNILQIYWTKYGLGEKCLLVSETKSVGSAFKNKYINTEFVTTDFYLELQPNPECDVVWDLCSSKIPEELNCFSSVINQATLEHIKDPVQVLQNLVEVTKSKGYLFLQTHTPAFYYHGYPKDYLRYFPDWFIDLPETLSSIDLVELLCFDGHAFAVYQKK